MAKRRTIVVAVPSRVATTVERHIASTEGMTLEAFIGYQLAGMAKAIGAEQDPEPEETEGEMSPPAYL